PRTRKSTRPSQRSANFSASANRGQRIGMSGRNQAARFRRFQRMTGEVTKLLVRYRRLLNLLVHCLLIVASNRVAFWLRFEGEVSPSADALAANLLPLLVAIRSATFVPFRLFEGLWRYTSLWDVRNVIMAVSTSSLA